MTTHTIFIHSGITKAIGDMVHATDIQKTSAVLSGVYLRVLAPASDGAAPRIRLVATNGKMLVERTLECDTVSATWQTRPSVGPFKDEILELSDPRHPDCTDLDGIILSAEACKAIAKAGKKLGGYRLVMDSFCVALCDKNGDALTVKFQVLEGRYPETDNVLMWVAPTKLTSASAIGINPAYLTSIGLALGLCMKESIRNSAATLIILPALGKGKGHPVIGVRGSMTDPWTSAAPYRALLMPVMLPK